jgi:hypothetical protein
LFIWKLLLYVICVAEDENLKQKETAVKQQTSAGIRGGIIGLVGSIASIFPLSMPGKFVLSILAGTIVGLLWFVFSKFFKGGATS